MHQKIASIQISHQELLMKMLIFSQIFSFQINNSIYQSEFPSVLKQINITPVFKKCTRNSKENYRPVSILSNISKIFERCMFCQVSGFMNSYLAKQQCGFRKGYSTQLQSYCLLVLLEKRKNAVDKGKCFGALLTDLSKALNCLPHELLKICSKFTGEHLCQSAISIKLLCNFIEIALRHGCSPVKLLHIFRTPFLKNTSGRLLL